MRARSRSGVVAWRVVPRRVVPWGAGLWALSAAPVGAPALAAQPLPEEVADALVTDSVDERVVLRHLPGEGAVAGTIRGALAEGTSTVEAFFGAPYPEPVVATVVPDRAAFDFVLREAWGVPETACWMVATGVADFLVLLSPRAWKAEACEHDPTDGGHLSDIVTHELAHVYHGQRNPTRDFTGAEGIGWFLEGVAVLVAGQLDRDRLSDPAEALENGGAPTRLEDAWSGRYRYGVSGSLVRYIDERHGRDVLRRLLAVTSEEALLAELGTTEKAPLAAWREWVRNQGGGDGPRDGHPGPNRG